MERGLRVVAWIAAALYVAVGSLELILADDSFGHRLLFALVLTGFALLVVVGVALIRDRPWVGAVMASAGGLAAAFALFWTIAAILLGVAIVVLSVLVARRASEGEVRSA